MTLKHLYKRVLYKFIGFANKANGKRLLKQHFTENKDYKIALIRWDERKNEGGYNQETIYKSKTDVYIKTGITMKKLVSIIENKDIILESRWQCT